MNKKEILEKLQLENKNLRLPSGIDFNIKDKVLTISMTKKGLTENMQTDASAFEGWAIFLIAWLPNMINQVIIDGELPTDTSDKHYQRFLYRLNKFTNTFQWASTNFYEKQLVDFNKKNEHIVINVPKSEATRSASHCEAQLERAFCKENKDNYDAINQQLPVRLFRDVIKEQNAITPKSYLDIWSIKDRLLRIFELKLPSNTEIGIISELMFYVNVMADVIKGDVVIPFSSEFRSFDQLFEFQRSNKCKKIEGVLLADNLHTGIKEKLNEVLKIINDGDFGFNIEFQYEKPKYSNYSVTKDDSIEKANIKKEKSYKQCQKEKQLALLQHSDLFEDAIGCGIWWNNKKHCWEQYPHILHHQDSLKNLFAPIRQEVLSYFNEYDIAWWREDEDRYFPTGNLLSSQIHCLNHLFKLRTDPEAVLSIVKKLCPTITKVLPSPIDWHEYVFEDNQPKKIDSYISFEFTFDNIHLLKESTCKRGKKCTSIDAFVYAEDVNEYRILIPIEWKYTESYEKKKEYRVKDYVVNKRYKDLASQNYSNLNGWKEDYYWDPLYEFARQTLLMEQIIHEKPKCGAFPIKADYYIHIIVRPNENKEIINDIQRFKDSVKDEGRKKIIEIDPKDLLEPLRNNTQYSDLINYLETRYWK